MSKRRPDDYLTKDDDAVGRSGEDEIDPEDVRKDAPPEVLGQRKIRGMPKRKLGGTSSSGSFGSTPDPSTPAPAPAPAFSFSNPSALPSSTPTAPPPSSAKPMFNFGPPAGGSNPFAGFGTGAAAATLAPAAAAVPVSSTGSAFGGGMFSFTNLNTNTSSTAAPASSSTNGTSASTTAPTQDKPKSNPFAGGFSFTNPIAAPAAATPAQSQAKEQEKDAGGVAGKNVAAPGGGLFSFSGSGSGVGVNGSASAPAPVAGESLFAFGNTNNNTSGATSTTTPVPTTSLYPTLPSTIPITAPTPTDPPSPNQTYLLSLRSLNLAVLRALDLKVKENPFLDMGEALRLVRGEWEREFGEVERLAGRGVDRGVKGNGMEVEKAEKQKSVAAAPAPAPVVTGPPKAGTFTLPSTTPTAPVSGGFKPTVPVSGAFMFGGQTMSAAAETEKEKESAPAAGAGSGFGGFGGFGAPAPAAGTAATNPMFAFNTTTTTDKPASLFGSTTTPTAPTNTGAKKPSEAAAFVTSMLNEPEPAASEPEAQPEPKTTTPAPTPFTGFGAPASSSSKKSSSSSSLFAIKPSVRKSEGGPGSSSMVVPSGVAASGAAPFVFKATPDVPSASAGNKDAAGAGGAKGGMFGFAAPPTPKRLVSTGFQFGATPSTPAAGDASTDATGATSAPTFNFGAPAGSSGFGATTAQPTSSMFSFTNPAASGTTPTSAFGLPPAPAAGGSSGGFSFGGAAAAPAAATPVSGADGDNAPPEAQTDLTVGAGEEDEDTLFEQKALVGHLTKEGKWDTKMCIVRLKRDKVAPGDASAVPMRRLLMRVDPSGAIAYNFSLRSVQAMTAPQESTYKLFVAQAEGGLQQIIVRFGKKKPGFDPAPIMARFKTAIDAERTAMKLPDFPAST